MNHFLLYPTTSTQLGASKADPRGSPKSGGASLVHSLGAVHRPAMLGRVHRSSLGRASSAHRISPHRVNNRLTVRRVSSEGLLTTPFNGSGITLTPFDRLVVQRREGSHAIRSHSAAEGRFTTVLHYANRTVACKRWMSHEEKRHFLLHGVTPLRVPSPLPIIDDATAFDDSKRAVNRLIDDREAALSAVYGVIPHPETIEEMSACTGRFLLDPKGLGQCRVHLIHALHRLRLASSAVCQALVQWREGLRLRKGYFGELPSEELSFFYRGVDYVLKMGSDLSFLPAPTVIDPLLLTWFDDCSWIVDHSLSLAARRHVVGGEEVQGRPAWMQAREQAEILAVEAAKHMSATFAILPDDGPRAVGASIKVHNHEHSRLLEAQLAILGEIDRRGHRASTEHLVQEHVKVAKRRNQRGVRGRDNASPAGWRWAALQVVLYGSEIYSELATHLPAFLHWRTSYMAAVRIQTWHRKRLLHWFTAVSLQVIERRRVRLAAAQLAREITAAVLVQQRYRSKRIRDAMRAISWAGVEHDRAQHMAAMQALAVKREEAQQRRMVAKATERLQRSSRAWRARQAVRRLQETKHANNAHAAVALSASDCARKLVAVHARHQIAKGVICEVYSQVCLAYEDGELKRDSASLRASLWLEKLREASASAISAQQQIGERFLEMVAISSRVADQPAIDGGGAASSSQREASAAPPPAEPELLTSKEMPDVLGIHATFQRALTDARSEVRVLRAELDAWERLHTNHTVEPVTGARVEQLRDASMKPILAAQRVARRAAYDDAQSAWPFAPSVEGKRIALRSAQAAVMLEGAHQALLQTKEWQVPGVASQSSLFTSVRASVASAVKVEERRAEASAEARHRLIIAEGENTICRELAALYDALNDRSERIRLLQDEMRDYGVTLKLRKLAETLPAKELAAELSPNLPPVPSVAAQQRITALSSRRSSPAVLEHKNAEGTISTSALAGGTATSGTNAADWEAWLALAVEEHAAAASRLQRGEAKRHDHAQELLVTATERLASAEAQLAEADELVREWLLHEGCRRLLATLQGRERRRLRKQMISKRSQVFRRMFSLPIKARVASKRAARDIHVSTAASQLAAQLEALPIQARQYTEGTVAITVFNAQTTVLSELVVPEEEEKINLQTSKEQQTWREQWLESVFSKREAMLRGLHMLVGELARPLRVQIQSLTSPEPSGKWIDGVWQGEQSTTKLVLQVTRVLGEESEGGPQSAVSILRKFEDAYKSSLLAEALDVPPASICSLYITEPIEEVQEAPTLIQLKEEATRRLEAINEELAELQLRKRDRDENLRIWHRIDGALTHLKQIDVKQLASGGEDGTMPAPASDPNASLKKASQPLLFPTDNTPLDSAGMDDCAGSELHDETPQAFVSRWLGVRDISRAYLAATAAQSDKERRAALKEEKHALDGRLELIRTLQECCLTWKQVVVPGSPHLIDVRWNVGLPMASERDAALGDVTGRGCYCYYCASLIPPIKSQHRFAECPKRRKANVAEYAPEKLAKLSRESQEKVDSSHKLIEELQGFRPDDGTDTLQKELYELAGAIKVLGMQDSIATGSAPPPPPPSARQETWNHFQRKQQHTIEHVVKLMAKASRSESMSESVIHGSWGELKATALMTPQPQLVDAPMTPAMLVATGQTLGLDISPSGTDHHLLDLIIEVARSPIPVHWELVDVSKDLRYVNVVTGQECRGHPSARVIGKLAAGLKARAQRTGANKPKAGDIWVLFADTTDGLPYFYNLLTAERQWEFPPSAARSLTPCVLPPRKLEPSAQVLANAAYGEWAELSSYSLESAAIGHFWDEGRRRALGERLAHRPCRLEVLVQQGQALGIDAAKHPELMWLAACAMVPTVPVGWFSCSAFGLDQARQYFCNVCGLKQWEHPEVSYLCGIAARLTESRSADTKRPNAILKDTPMAITTTEVAIAVKAALGIRMGDASEA